MVTVVDLKSGCFQMTIKEKDEHDIVFSINGGNMNSRECRGDYKIVLKIFNKSNHE